ncbi:MAG: tRNA guanosine(34) transglycosylase Tgt [Planctomycetota bacterium]|nr:MAG: tRNA guanosine(34) transglycosylase Tgt [Planctomycetota bacterium]
MSHHFELLRGSAIGPRRGRYTTPHGSFETPCFAPVGTAATVKGMFPEQVAELGAELILANTYHLAIRPGSELIAQAGGLHQFMRWKGPILTDSGGYQVFSLAGKRSVNDDGVRFAGENTGQELYLSPETALRIQSQLGSDIAMVLDECSPHDASRRQLERAHKRTLLWAGEAKRIHQERGGKDCGQALFGIVQGGMDRALRRESAETLVRLGFDGYAVGGVSVGESKPEMDQAVEASLPYLPEQEIRYLMGIGHPDDIFESVLRGIDMFDCVSPTRHGRTNLVYVPAGKIKIKNARWKDDFSALQEDCGCPCCSGFTKAYLRHLAQCGEMLGAILLSMHNIYFLEQLLAQVRERIHSGAKEAELREWFAASYPGWAGKRGSPAPTL